MASTKSSTKSSPGKRPVPATVVVPAKAKPVTKPKPVVKPAPAVKLKPAPKAVPKAAAAKPARARGGKSAGVPLEQRRHYVERINTDSSHYGGSDLGNGGRISAEPQPWMGFPASLSLTLPPLAALVLLPA